MAVFLLSGLLLLGAASLGRESYGKSQEGILGGPASSREAQAIGQELTALVGKPVLLARADSGFASGRDFPATELEDSSVQDLGQPIGPVSYRPDLFIYKVLKGDVLSRIAGNFGVSVQTIIDANPKVRASSLQVGDELIILPVSGFVYKTKEDDTLESVAALFSVREDRLREVNPSVNFSALDISTPLVIPGVKRADYAYAAGADSSLSDLGNYFIMPTEGFNWGKPHFHNAVDIANACGTPVRAAAEGLVIPDDSFGDGISGWNGGYGNFVLIEHPFGDKVRTRYAHLGKGLVEIGNYVKQGQEIGTMGETGEATGCHVHFEVYGAKNPFARW